MTRDAKLRVLIKKNLDLPLHRPRRLFLVLILVLGIFFTVAPASGQTPASISIEPAQSNIYLNSTNLVTVEVWVRNVVNVNTFDITFHYDPSVVQLVSWEHGGILVPPLFKNKEVNDPIAGTLRLSFTKIGGAGYTGDGVLLRLTFRGIEFGESFLTMSPAQLWAAGVEVLPLTINNGTVVTGYQFGVIVNSSLSGNISLQGQSLRGGIPVSLATGLYVGYGPYTTLSLAQPDNNFFFTSIVMDAYPIRTAFPTYLNLDASSNKVKGLVGTSNTLPMLVLLAGNVNTADNVINNDDLDLIRANFDLNTRVFKSSIKLNGDANGDGIVDIRDLALAGGNYGLNGATAYLDWMP